MQKRIGLKIYGKVQGVFFRDSSQRRVKELNLSGWVRNEPDGTIQIVAEGEEKDLKEIVKNTVWHEIAHHFGMDEAQVREAEIKRRKISR